MGLFNLHTMARVWKRAHLSYEDPSICAFCASFLKKCGRPLKYVRNVVPDAILQVPRGIKGSLRKIAAAIGLSTTTLHQMKEDRGDSVIHHHSDTIKPTLDDDHDFARVIYAVSNMNLGNENYHDYYKNSVHVYAFF
jgi:hypothetical protein